MNRRRHYLERINEFYFPLLVILGANSDDVKGRISVVKERVDELVRVIQGKRHLATLETLDYIPENAEYIAYQYWCNEVQPNSKKDEYYYVTSEYLKFPDSGTIGK